MRHADIPAVEELTAEAFAPVTGSTTAKRDASSAEQWRVRAEHLLTTDPDGCWVADADHIIADVPGSGDGGIVGAAMSARRDLLWLLATYAVEPGHQGKGIGAALLDKAIEYGAGCLRGFIAALPDAKALRRYRRAGFALHPTMRLTGVVDRSTLPVVEDVREGTPADRDLAESVDRRIRGAAHGRDHDLLAAGSRFLVCDRFTGSGYAYVRGSSVILLAATTRAIAQQLLWSSLAMTPTGDAAIVRYLTSDQDWAVDVGLAAGLNIERDGFLALRYMKPPAPYIPSVHFG